MLRNSIISLAITALTASCLTEGPDPDGVDEEAINGPWFTPTKLETSAAVFKPPNFGCTGTLISYQHVLSAMHCNWARGGTVYLYSDASGYDHAQAFTVSSIAFPPGTQWSADGVQDWTDSVGDFADMVVVTISPPITRRAAMHRPAAVAWTFPGDQVAAVKVGAGHHDDEANKPGTLRAVDDTTDSSDDSGGGFHTTYIRDDDGDSGGPLYVGGRVLGTLTGDFYEGAHSRYTSAPHRIDWILSEIAYAWSGDTPQPQLALGGTAIETILSSELVCQYACEKTTGCVGYNWLTVPPHLCTTFSSVTNTAFAPAYHSGQR